jgi:S-formylglutathione hydrolase FrmB
MFHGTSGGAADWTTMGDAAGTTAGRDLIVVMPDAGVNSDGGGWFTDWVNGGRFGPPRWETYHVFHLIPWIDANLRTVASRAGRAISGLSQGGYGAMAYAARHPDASARPSARRSTSPPTRRCPSRW